tara:strand:+ start:5800 stop:6087 length:288 start_codon:yes stop_codon:yes gene_type:complete
MPIKNQRPVSELPVMEKCCKTCPFKKVGRTLRWQDPKLASAVIERNLFKGQQICHGTETENRKPRNRCRGYWDYSTPIYKRLGMPSLLNPPRNEK